MGGGGRTDKRTPVFGLECVDMGGGTDGQTGVRSSVRALFWRTGTDGQTNTGGRGDGRTHKHWFLGPESVDMGGGTDGQTNTSDFRFYQVMSPKLEKNYIVSKEIQRT